MAHLAALCWLLSGCAPGSPAPKVVAGTADDLMVVRHVVVRGTNEQIGKQLAEIAKKNHHVRLDALDAANQNERMAWFTHNYPEVLERAQGVRAAFGEQKNADYTMLPYNLDLQPACSVVFYPPASVTNSHAMLSRNYDFPKAKYAEMLKQTPPAGARSMTGDPYVIEMYPTKGYASLYICSYDLLQGVIDGINEKGVSVALLADDMTKSRTRGKVGVGLGEIDLTRFVLDRASNAAQARELLRQVPYYSTFVPCHYIISDASGDSFIFEVDTKNANHIIDSDGKPQVITNHSIFEYGTDNLPSGNSFDRYRRLQDEIAKRKGKVTPAEVKEINYCVAVPEEVKVHATLWHAVYDLTDRSVQVSFCLSGPTEAKERRSPYLSFKLRR